MPFGAGTFGDKAIAAVQSAAEIPAKHVTLVRNGVPEHVETRAATVDDLLVEAGIARAPEDRLDTDPTAPLVDGATIAYRAAVPVTLIVDQQPRIVRSASATVAGLLSDESVLVDRHDRVAPRADTPLAGDIVVTVTHINAWTERRRVAIAPPTKRMFDIAVPIGKTRILSPGRTGIREISYLLSRSATGMKPRRTTLASRILRTARTRVVVEGIGEYAAFARLARQGFDSTLRLTGSALTMLATAYTAACSGCSGMTASGVPAGHGVVAVDPNVIPLGSRLFIPGYGRATAGDTGGAIRGHRIDLGFDSLADANQFGRRSIVVYVLK